jgi:hypothetical protein
MTTQTAERDALALIRAFREDRDGAVAMMTPLSPDELLEMVTTLVGLVKVARTVGTDLTLDAWCCMLLQHLDNTVEED